jgi:hypothetical protein
MTWILLLSFLSQKANSEQNKGMLVTHQPCKLAKKQRVMMWRQGNLFWHAFLSKYERNFPILCLLVALCFSSQWVFTKHEHPGAVCYFAHENWENCKKNRVPGSFVFCCCFLNKANCSDSMKEFETGLHCCAGHRPVWAATELPLPWSFAKSFKPGYNLRV